MKLIIVDLLFYRVVEKGNTPKVGCHRDDQGCDDLKTDHSCTVHCLPGISIALMKAWCNDFFGVCGKFRTECSMICWGGRIRLRRRQSRKWPGYPYFRSPCSPKFSLSIIESSLFEDVFNEIPQKWPQSPLHHPSNDFVWVCPGLFLPKRCFHRRGSPHSLVMQYRDYRPQ